MPLGGAGWPSGQTEGVLPGKAVYCYAFLYSPFGWILGCSFSENGPADPGKVPRRGGEVRRPDKSPFFRTWVNGNSDYESNKAIPHDQGDQQASEFWLEASLQIRRALLQISRVYWR